MTLVDRLSASYLGALALILLGFSGALLASASIHLHLQVDRTLEATLATLSAMVEDEDGGLIWESEGRPPLPGQDPDPGQVRWLVRDDRDREVARSRNLDAPEVLRRAASRRRVDQAGRPWQVAERILRSDKGSGGSRDGSDRTPMMILSVGSRLDPVDRTLRNLALALASISGALWAANALIGRRLCRRALAPLSRMAVCSRELGVDDPGSRLPVPTTGDELEDLGRSFNGLLDRWHEALVRQSRFAADASHQLRTPLAALIGQAEVALRRDRPPEEYRQALARVRDQAGRLARIVESLLYLARADAESGPPGLVEFDLLAWVDEQVERRRLEAAGDHLRWETTDGAPLPILAHPVLLAEALDNLLDNARDHGRSGSPAALRVDRPPGFATITVEDGGPGIKPADLARVFEPFFRADGAREGASRGVGLGLAVARRVVESMGGSIGVESRPGEGSRFTIRLPAPP